jgi:hypothetical protein
MYQSHRGNFVHVCRTSVRAAKDIAYTQTDGVEGERSK